MSSIISMEKRRQTRAALAEFARYVAALDAFVGTGKPLPAGMAEALAHSTGTTDVARQLSAIRTMYEVIDNAYDEELRFAAQFRLSHFCEYMFRDEPPALHHEFLIEHMERVHSREALRTQISMPPGAAKSSYASIRFPAWHLGRKPNERWLQGAHTMSFAKDRLGKPVRSLVQEPRFREVFPDFRLSPNSSAADYFEFHNARGYYKAIGVGQGISGYRADIAGVDDPIASREDAESATLRRKLHDWWEDDFSTRPMPGSPIFIVLTRWHEMDLAGYLLDKAKHNKGDHWDVINIPALAREDDPLGRRAGEGLWPEVFGTAVYENIRRTSPARKWNSLYMGNPIDEAGGVLSAEDIRYYKTPPKDEMRGDQITRKVIRRVTLSVDCAEKVTERSDFTAATVWIETTDKRHYLVHAERCRKEFSDMVAWIEEIAAVWQVSSILVEDRGAGTQYIQIRDKHPGPVPVIACQTKQQSKGFRFDGVTPMFASGQVLLPESGNDWGGDLIAELLSFPNGKNDDYVDSVSQYLSRTRERSSRRGVRKIRSSQTA